MSVLRLVACACLAALLCAALSVVAAPAQAQRNEPSGEVYETCALYNVVVNTGASPAALAAQQLRDLSPPNPPGVEDALAVLIDFEDGGETPSSDEVEAAYETLDRYYGSICTGLDVCPLIVSAINTDDPLSQRSADWADRILAPSPPGIGAALSLLGGKIRLENQLIHESIDDARDVVRSYFASCTLAHTGSTALPVALIGIGMAATGSAVLIVRRNLGSAER